MSKRLAVSAVAAVALLTGGGCYTDETAAPIGGSVARVFLTDAPFPYDSVASVNVHIVRIDANEQPDTTGAGTWVVVTAPNQTFDLLELQQGATALVGEGQLSRRLYRAIRLVIDADKSSIIWANTSRANVTWPWPHTGLITMYALVQEPLAQFADADSIEIVIDFDVGRSFLYNYFGTKEFTVLPWLRAVHRAFTGAISGTVTSAYSGESRPIKNANVTVYAGGDPGRPETWYVAATGRTDAAGHYTIAFVSAGTYRVRIEQPDYPFLAPVTTPDVVVTNGGTTTVSVSLPEAGTGGAYVRVSGPTSVGIGGAITLRAAVGNANGDPILNPSVTWTSSNAVVASVSGVGDTASVSGREPGFATITATSGGLRDSLRIQVIGSAAPVATVTIVPGTANLAVGDSAWFRADLRDDAGNLLSGKPITWFTADSGVIRLFPYGTTALVRPTGAGTATLRATSDGKSGQATITVH